MASSAEIMVLDETNPKSNDHPILISVLLARGLVEVKINGVGTGMDVHQRRLHRVGFVDDADTIAAGDDAWYFEMSFDAGQGVQALVIIFARKCT